MLGQCGRASGICPPMPLEIPSRERDPAQQVLVYESGRAVAQLQNDKLQDDVEECKAGPEE